MSRSSFWGAIACGCFVASATCCAFAFSVGGCAALGADVGPITNLGACIVGRVAIDDSASPHMSDEAIAEDVIVACLTDATTAVTTLAKIRAAKAAQTVAKDAGK